MSSTDGGAGSTARASAELQQALAGISLPAIREALAAYTGDLGQPGQEPSSIRKAYGDLKAGVKQDFAANRTAAAAYIKQQALQSGGLNTGAAQNEALGILSQGLRSSEAQQLRAINFQEAQSGLNQTNMLLSNITGVAGRALSGSMGFGSNALQSDQLLAQYEAQARQQNAQYGAYAGTVLGAILAPYTGGASIPIGSAAGGLIGGLW